MDRYPKNTKICCTCKFWLGEIKSSSSSYVEVDSYKSGRCDKRSTSCKANDSCSYYQKRF